MEHEQGDSCVQKGDKTLAANYRPVGVIGPIAKLYATCINLELERQAQANGWWAAT